MEQKTFKCNISNYEIKILYDKDSALIDSIETDHKHVKSLLLLLKNAIDWIKKSKIKTIKQYVNIDDYNNILKKCTTFQIDNNSKYMIDTIYNSKIILVKCSEEDFLENYCKAVGIV